MAKYPVEYTDNEGVNEAVNYLLSGPSGLGQNFAGFSSSTTGYLTGNFRVPFAQSTPANLYVAPIALGVSEMLDGRTWKHNFAAPQASPPFALGNNIEVVGVADPFYDGVYRPIGVVECTTTYVIARTSNSYAIVPPSSGGTVGLNPVGGYNSTDSNARVTVQSPTDRVFISAQLNEITDYLATITSSLNVTVAVNRYKGEPNTDPVNPDYIFDFDATIAERTYFYPTLIGSGSLTQNDTVFASIIDQPTPGYYWYILEISFLPLGGDVVVTQSQFGFRALSAQVVKQ